jgi:hydrogenase nickel incorporation protein HypB
MCEFCGCSSEGDTSLKHQHGAGAHQHQHHDDHGDHERPFLYTHSHHHEDNTGRIAEVSKAILEKNSRLAERARGLLLGKRIASVNLVSSPGSGKTTLLQETIRAIQPSIKCAVIVGDCATDIDARRIRETGVAAIQITTGNVCHLDAHMVLHALEEIDLDSIQLLFIENVGNLVCPTAFDLGEDRRVVLSSVTEGEDKPLKYPNIFHDADLVLLTKVDLAEVLETDLATARSNVLDAAPRANVLEISARTGAGVEAWLEWLSNLVTEKRAAGHPSTKPILAS